MHCGVKPSDMHKRPVAYSVRRWKKGMGVGTKEPDSASAVVHGAHAERRACIDRHVDSIARRNEVLLLRPLYTYVSRIREGIVWKRRRTPLTEVKV